MKAYTDPKTKCDTCAMYGTTTQFSEYLSWCACCGAVVIDDPDGHAQGETFTTSSWEHLRGLGWRVSP